MQEITTITSAPKQRFRLVLENNETADFQLYYCGRMRSWYYNISYNDFTVNGAKVVLTPNSLRNLRRLIPFGIAFVTDGYTEPFLISDFSSGRVKMYVLTSDEVEQVEEEIFNQ